MIKGEKSEEDREEREGSVGRGDWWRREREKKNYLAHHAQYKGGKND